MTKRSFLDLSSGHLSAETWVWLDTQTTDEMVRSLGPSAQVVLASGMRYGWFVYANEEPEEGIPADLAAVFRLARQRGCEYVLFDCDAIPLEDLPILHPDFAEAAAESDAAEYEQVANALCSLTNDTDFIVVQP